MILVAKKGWREKMEDRINVVNFEEVHDHEVDDIWDIFFPKASERKVRQLHDQQEQSKPRRYLKFLTI